MTIPRFFVGRGLTATLGVAALLGALSITESEARKVRHHGAHVNVNHHVKVNKNVRHVTRNVHRDIHTHWDRHHYHPVARGVAVGTAAAVTAAAIGSIAYSLPSGCGYRTINGVRYYHCGGNWYQQRYSGSQLTYVVVPPP